MRMPTREQLRAQVKEILKVKPHYRQCINCMNYDPGMSICLPKGVKVFPRVPGCNEHELAMERIITDATQNLYESPVNLHEDKIEYLLSLGLTTVNAGTLFLEDAEARIRKIYKACEEKEDRKGLRKDLDLFKRLVPASKAMADSIEAIDDSYRRHMQAFMQETEGHLANMEAQYRQYFQEHLDKIFKKNGKYDGEKDAQFLASAGSFCLTIMDRLKAVLKAEGESFPFDDMDLRRYIIKK